MQSKYNDSVIRLYEPLDFDLTITKTQNTTITTKEYGDLIDFQAGCWAAVIGHNRNKITKVINEYGSNLMHIHQFFETDNPDSLVKELSSAAGFSDLYSGLFLASGSEAVLLACSLAKLLADRQKLLSFSMSYHGSFSDLRLPRDQTLWTDLDVKECLDCNDFNACKNCAKVNNINFNDYAGFVFEAGNSGGMVLCPPEKLIAYLSRNIREAGGYVISNEITTGFGRTGKWFGHQHYNCLTETNYNPDFIAMGKGLGNGYPISAVFVKKHLADKAEKTKYKYVQSHQNDPLGCRISREVVKIIKDDKLIEKGNDIGNYLSSQINGLIDKKIGIKSIRNRGLMIVIVLDEDIEVYDVFKELLENGIYVSFSKVLNYLHIYPAMTITKAEIDCFCKTLEAILEI